MRPLYDLASVFTDEIRTAETESSRVYEPVIGVVTDNKDPSKLGRVKLKIPILSDQDTTFWCPIVMLAAGVLVGRLVLAVPQRADDERAVEVAVLVVGALWNGKDKPPDKNPGGVPRRTFKSREGSKITFDDENKKLIIEDGAGKAKITFDSQANKMTIEAIDGDVCFQTPTDDMTIVAQSIEMTANTNLEIHSGEAMQWGAGGSATIKSSGTTLSGSKVNTNCGSAQMPEAPTTNPQDIEDPYGS